jgi:hypothetical protein
MAGWESVGRELPQAAGRALGHRRPGLLLQLHHCTDHRTEDLDGGPRQFDPQCQRHERLRRCGPAGSCLAQVRRCPPLRPRLSGRTGLPARASLAGGSPFAAWALHAGLAARPRFAGRAGRSLLPAGAGLAGRSLVAPLTFPATGARFAGRAGRSLLPAGARFTGRSLLALLAAGLRAAGSRLPRPGGGSWLTRRALRAPRRRPGPLPLRGGLVRVTAPAVW